MTERTFEIAPDGKSITCGLCGAVSHHQGDIAARYCGRCHRFHDDASWRQFDCADCGRPIVQLGGPPAGTTCFTCQMIPRWWADPRISALLDPDNHRRPRSGLA